MELLEILTLNTPNLVNKQPIITSKIHSDLYMVYSKKINAWIWCDPNGKALEYEGDLIRVDLSKDVLEDDTWYIYSDNNKSQKLKEIIKNKVNMHVYCTDCKHFKLTCDMPDECFDCYCKDCSCIDLEDSKDIEIRHKFEQREAMSMWEEE